MYFIKLFILTIIGISFIGCSASSSGKERTDSRFHYYSNSTGKSFAGNKMRVRKLSATQYKIKIYQETNNN